jgi:hypothetical protein
MITLLIAALLSLLPSGTADSLAPALLPACATEDSAACYWDASTHGNGLGRSFWTDHAGTLHRL